MNERRIELQNGLLVTVQDIRGKKDPRTNIKEVIYETLQFL